MSTVLKSHVRVLIVDDHTLVRAGITRLLQALPDVDVVAEASDAQQALDLAIIHRPDIILLDLSLPDRSGLEVLQPLKEAVPGVKVVIMSMHNDPGQVRSALDRGCAGFVVKEAAPMELELAIRSAVAGQVFLSPQVSAKMLAPLLGNGKPTGIAALSPRQRQILRKLGGGMSSKEIAAHLGISVKTVETHRARMMESLGCRRANDLLLLAARHQSDLA
ncbi:two component transcriptional regulator, LuxR family [Pseudoxanthomonas wuyuanensis]|uniref:Two component transcriptional regulator, LuxR family n=1 Tax=Pseudoxanthomonas wuyuanensis TaxID=1073196 RepID=A0A286CZW6_9GAMM|nr:two component transcriptional regulator, LuxR family [Pseudoxanthomonas wuyuanensis]